MTPVQKIEKFLDEIERLDREVKTGIYDGGLSWTTYRTAAVKMAGALILVQDYCKLMKEESEELGLWAFDLQREISCILEDQ